MPFSTVESQLIMPKLKKIKKQQLLRETWLFRETEELNKINQLRKGESDFSLEGGK